MKLPRWDRLYFFAFSSAMFATFAFLVILFVPLIEINSSESGVSQRTLLADGQTLPVLLSLIPLVLSLNALFVIPKDGVPDKSQKINLWLSTILVYIFVVVSILSVGILYVPTAILMTAAAVGSMVRRRNRTVYARSPQESKSGLGGGKRRRNKG
jgi:hypothetical protein